MNGHLPCLEGMSFVEVSLCSVHVPGGFGGRAGPEVSGDCVFSRVCWQPPQWWEAGLESKGRQPEPGASQGFS